MAPELSLQSLVTEQPMADRPYTVSVRDTLRPLLTRGKLKPFNDGELSISYFVLEYVQHTMRRLLQSQDIVIGRLLDTQCWQ